MNRDKPFGYSLALVNGDLVFANGEFQLVSDKANLLQALNLRVLTPFSSDIFNTTYGLDVTEAFTQAQGLSMMKELLKMSLVRTLGTDPRVHDVLDVLFSDDPRYLAMHPLVNPDASRQTRFWAVDVLIETADTQTATLALNIGA